MLPQEKNRRPLAGLTKEELRRLCAVHYRTAVAREAQGKEFILRAKPGAKTAPRAKHDEWRKVEGFKPKFTSARTPGHADPHTRKRFSYTENK
jgi:hypothetical protein